MWIKPKWPLFPMEMKSVVEFYKQFLCNVIYFLRVAVISVICKCAAFGNKRYCAILKCSLLFKWEHMTWFKKSPYELTHYGIGAKYSEILTVQAWMIANIYNKSIFPDCPILSKPFISPTSHQLLCNKQVN